MKPSEQGVATAQAVKRARSVHAHGRLRQEHRQHESEAEGVMRELGPLAELERREYMDASQS